MNKISLLFSPGSLDSVGASLSMLCAIHCIALPLLITLLPLLGLEFLLGASLERIFILCSIIFATGNLCWGFRLHRRLRGLFALTTGIALIFAGRSLMDNAYEVTFTVVGASFLAAAHLMNRHLCHICQLCQDQEKSI